MAPTSSNTKKCRWSTRTKKYETSTRDFHRFLPSVPQDFDCRVRATLKPGVLDQSFTVGKEAYKSSYNEAYVVKSIPPKSNPPVLYLQGVHYINTIQEKTYANPPPPIKPKCSEMKDSYRMNYLKSQQDIKSPIEASHCYISKFGCEQQPAILPDRKGFWRWTDPYFTTYKSTFLPIKPDDALTEKIMTFYNVGEFDLPLPSGNPIMWDKLVFKSGVPTLPNRIVPRYPPRVPNFGIKTEYNDSYIHQCYSELHPYLLESCTVCQGSLNPPASRDQTCPAPGMYCTEYCHYGVGTSWPVRAVVEPKTPPKDFSQCRNVCCGPIDTR